MEWQPRVRRVAWALFGLEVLLVLGWAVKVDCGAPPTTVSAATSPAGVRFKLTEAQRRRIYEEILKGEPADRVESTKISEAAVWNRNHDDRFHEYEWRRIAGAAARHGIPAWEAYLMLDEGMRAHWPPPPGVDVYLDEAPLGAHHPPGRAAPPPPQGTARSRARAAARRAVAGTGTVAVTVAGRAADEGRAPAARQGDAGARGATMSGDKHRPRCSSASSTSRRSG